MNPNEDVLMHYGMPRRSGRYPWGSGDDPYQHGKDFLSRVDVRIVYIKGIIVIVQVVVCSKAFDEAHNVYLVISRIFRFYKDEYYLTVAFIVRNRNIDDVTSGSAYV